VQRHSMFDRPQNTAIVIATLVVLMVTVDARAQTDPCAQPAVAAAVAPQPLAIAGTSTYVYKRVDGTELRAHVLTPERRSSARVPAAVFFFGGGWMWGAVTDPLPAARYLTSRGLVSILVDYRLWCRQQANVTHEIADARSAVRWVRAHAQELGVDPDRILATGPSSGGHLALSTAVFDQFDEPTEDKSISARPNALVLFFPCVDPSSEAERQYSALALGSHGQDVAPLYHVTRNLPPTAIYQGTDDPIYPGVVKFVGQARAKGASVEFKTYEGANHGFTGPRVENGKYFREVWAEADRFLIALGYISGPPQGPQ